MLDALNAQLARLQTHPFYAGRLPGSVASAAEFAERVPLMTRAELVAEMNCPGYGAFAPAIPPVRVHLTPMGASLVPILQSAADLRAIEAACGQHLDACGIGPGDVCMVTFGYHLFVAGLFYQTQMEARGVACIPHGPGETERAARVAQQCWPATRRMRSSSSKRGAPCRACSSRVAKRSRAMPRCTHACAKRCRARC
ncbi:hypothetical protein AB3X93_29460 [Paraburkholderia sp. BR14262]|uniref:hypothetical protein n=1 Tax=Paraburkholderia sp. BR14262 TaxID=3236999 RepID=UPI0034CF2119